MPPGSWPLLLPIAVPAAVALLCSLIPRPLRRASGFLAVAGAIATLVLVCPLAWDALAGAGAGREQAIDIPIFDLFRLPLRVDAMAGFIALATSAFGVVIGLYSLGFMRGHERERGYYAWFLLTLAASLGAIMANELFLLLVFWGILGFTLYMMVGLSGNRSAAAAKKTFIIIGGSDCLFMLGIALVWLIKGSTRMDGGALPLESAATYGAFLCFAAAAFAKAGALPFHTWVPDCGEHAPVPVTAFLPASLDKLLGIYLLARAATGLFAMNPAMNSVLMLCGATTVIVAVMMALVQHDMKRLLSYHAVSQVGYMVLGIGCGNPIGLAGALFHMVNHAVYKSCLFLCAGSVEQRAKSTDLDHLGGLAKAMPITFVCFFVAALSISGIPPLNGFASKWMVYRGIVDSGADGGWLWTIWLAAAILGSALTLASFAKVLHAVFLRKTSPEVRAAAPREVGFTMLLPTALLAAICVVFGVAVYRVPMAWLIAPVLESLRMAEVVFGGWYAGPVSAMLLAGIGAGIVIYLLGTVRKARRCSTYVGGELLQTTYQRGVPRGDGRDVEVSGADFYRNVSDMGALRWLYRLAAKKAFDLYDVGIGVIFYAIGWLRRAHSGLLPRYLTWFVAGLLAVIFILLRGA